MIEAFKTVNRINPEFMRDVFEQKSTTYNLRYRNVLRITETKTKNDGMWTGRFLWKML